MNGVPEELVSNGPSVENVNGPKAALSMQLHIYSYGYFA